MTDTVPTPDEVSPDTRTTPNPDSSEFGSGERAVSRPVWGIPFATLSFLLVALVIGAMFWPIERYETAPGRADRVASLLSVDVGDTDAEVYEPEEGIRFVTALGTELTALQALMGWLDPVVDVQTCEERFGTCEPEVNREIQLGNMATAKEIAAYVALVRLGFDAEFVEGPAQVAGFDPDICPTDAPENRACRRFEVGDTIVGIEAADADGRMVDFAIEVVSDISVALEHSAPGDVVRISVRGIDVPADEVRTVEVELIESPSDPGRTIVGFNARDTRTVRLPIAIDFDTDSIGGPSAGLSFALALIDELTPGELVPPGGAAVTGTIAEDGSVGAIGALVQKAVAVERSGAKLFIVPAAQGEVDIADARAAVGDSLEIVAVATLDEALAALVERGGSPLPVVG